MTGREKILAAFTPAGTPEIGVVVAYEYIVLRDRRAEITKIPWWDSNQPAAVAQDFGRATGVEWFSVNECPARSVRARQRYEPRADGVWQIDGPGNETRLVEPTSSGTNTQWAHSTHTDLETLPATHGAIDALIPAARPFDRATFLAEGRQDAAVASRAAVDGLPYGYTQSPLWSLYGLLGYEALMVFLAQTPDLAAYAGQRLLAEVRQRVQMLAAVGAEAVWIEECLTDQIRPELFREVNVPIVQQVVQAIRAAGMKSIYYYCGNPNDRLDAILAIGADAIHFEESKKGFTIDIADICRQVAGRCVVFGNLDALHLLPHGAESQLRAKIRQQLEAGRHNGNRFVLSTGSPPAPETTVARVRRYTDLARELSRS